MIECTSKEVFMIDVSQILVLMRDARWDALVLIWNSIVTAVVANPWLGVLLGLIVVRASRKAWFRLLRYVASTYYGSHHHG
jgi:hypothetical protein